jgi:hypothetical protein
MNADRSAAALTPAVEHRGKLRGRPSGLKGRYHDRYATGLRPVLDPGASATPSPRSGTGRGCLPLPTRSPRRSTALPFKIKSLQPCLSGYRGLQVQR